MPHEIRIHQVDAFAGQLFQGNPASVCPLDEWLPVGLMQSIAEENNHSETAFFVPRAEPGQWDLRWFTPEMEVDLCGHATLASGWVVLHELRPDLQSASFHTRSGELVVERVGERLALDLPSRPPKPCEALPGLVQALGAAPTETLRGEYELLVYDNEQALRELRPDMAALSTLEDSDAIGISVTAPGDAVDFVSRFFAPRAGIPEDPVTGSAHSSLVPYWSGRLGKKLLEARQISRRGGALSGEDLGDRVRLVGEVAPFLRGTIRLG